MSEYKDFIEDFHSLNLNFLNGVMKVGEPIAGTCLRADITIAWSSIPITIYYLDEYSTVNSFEERLQTEPNNVTEILARGLSNTGATNVILMNYGYWKQRYSTQQDKKEYAEQMKEIINKFREETVETFNIRHNV